MNQWVLIIHERYCHIDTIRLYVKFENPFYGLIFFVRILSFQIIELVGHTINNKHIMI